MDLMNQVLILREGRVSHMGAWSGGTQRELGEPLPPIHSANTVIFLNQALAILHKDLLAEWRTKERLSPMAFFVLLVLLVFNFSFELGGAAMHEIGPWEYCGPLLCLPASWGCTGPLPRSMKADVSTV